MEAKWYRIPILILVCALGMSLSSLAQTESWKRVSAHGHHEKERHGHSGVVPPAGMNRDAKSTDKELSKIENESRRKNATRARPMGTKSPSIAKSAKPSKGQKNPPISFQTKGQHAARSTHKSNSRGRAGGNLHMGH